MTLPKVDVLDAGFVRLCDSMGDDLSIVRAARVSYDADWRVGDDVDKDAKLIRYLMQHRHTTPFEAVTFTFEVKAPIFVFRQWHRHRTWSYNEVSARYTELDEGFYVPQPGYFGVKSPTSKQARIVDPNSVDNNVVHDRVSSETIRGSCAMSLVTYQALLARGVPRELARSVLPVASYSRMFATVDLHNLFHFLRLRLHAHAQYEIRVYAEAMLELIKSVVPVAAAAFVESINPKEI